MDRTELFFNMRVEGQGAFSEIGNLCLTPYRYLFGGRTVQIIDAGNLKGIHHVASFHCLGNKNKCPTNSNLHSGDMNLFYTALAIALFIPGFILGTLFKALGCVLNNAEATDLRVWTDVVSKPFNEGFNRTLQAATDAFNNMLQGKVSEPINMMSTMIPTDDDLSWAWRSRILQIKTVGSRNNPITTQMTLNRAVSQLTLTPTDILVIFGDGKLQIEYDPGIYVLNPMKVILIGVKLGQEGISAAQHLDNKPKMPRLASVLMESGKWQRKTASSMKEALEDRLPNRKYQPCKRCHFIYEVAEPQTPTIPAGKNPQKKTTGSNIHTLHDNY